MQPSEQEIKAFEDRLRAQYKGQADPKPAPKTSKSIEVTEDMKPKTYKTRERVDINGKQTVSKPNLRDNSGKVVSPSSQTNLGPSNSAWSNHEAQRIALLRLEEEELKEKQSMTNEAIANKLAATERVVKRLQKEINNLKKEQS